LGPTRTGSFDSGSLWWQHEKLHQAVLQDFPTRAKAVRKERDALEKGFLMNAPKELARNCGELTAAAFQTAWEKNS
jgi:hypothetical protein